MISPTWFGFNVKLLYICLVCTLTIKCPSSIYACDTFVAICVVLLWRKRCGVCANVLWDQEFIISYFVFRFWPNIRISFAVPQNEWVIQSFRDIRRIPLLHDLIFDDPFIPISVHWPSRIWIDEIWDLLSIYHCNDKGPPSAQVNRDYRWGIMWPPYIIAGDIVTIVLVHTFQHRNKIWFDTDKALNNMAI